ncbi:MAG TPA: RidA family protein, partial [Gemmatirosa sp.]
MITRTTPWLAVAMATAAPLAAQQSPPTARGEWVAATAAAPLSQLVRVGETIWLSGTLGTRADGTLAPGGVGAETAQALTSMRAALARAGATMDDVVKCTVFLAD